MESLQITCTSRTFCRYSTEVWNTPKVTPLPFSMLKKVLKLCVWRKFHLKIAEILSSEFHLDLLDHFTYQVWCTEMSWIIHPSLAFTDIILSKKASLLIYISVLSNTITYTTNPSFIMESSIKTRCPVLSIADSTDWLLDGLANLSLQQIPNSNCFTFITSLC